MSFCIYLCSGVAQEWDVFITRLSTGRLNPFSVSMTAATGSTVLMRTHNLFGEDGVLIALHYAQWILIYFFSAFNMGKKQ